jgi:hypothetical protein
MKPDQNGWFGMGGALTQPKSCRAENLETLRSSVKWRTRCSKQCVALWWRAFDRICGCVMLIRLSIQDRIYGLSRPHPPTWNARPIKRRLVRAFPVGR